jgi:hypothetical protein
MRQLISMPPEMAGLLLATAKARGVPFNQVVRDIVADKYGIAPNPPKTPWPPRNKRKLSHAKISEV